LLGIALNLLNAGNKKAGDAGFFLQLSIAPYDG